MFRDTTHRCAGPGYPSVPGASLDPDGARSMDVGPSVSPALTVAWLLVPTVTMAMPALSVYIVTRPSWIAAWAQAGCRRRVRWRRRQQCLR